MKRIELRTLTLALAAALTGCSTAVTQGPGGSTFEEALRECRRAHPGRANRRAHLPAEHPDIAACLRRDGWLPDGTASPPGR